MRCAGLGMAACACLCGDTDCGQRYAAAAFGQHNANPYGRRIVCAIQRVFIARCVRLFGRGWGAEPVCRWRDVELFHRRGVCVRSEPDQLCHAGVRYERYGVCTGQAVLRQIWIGIFHLVCVWRDRAAHHRRLGTERFQLCFQQIGRNRKRDQYIQRHPRWTALRAGTGDAANPADRTAHPRSRRKTGAETGTCLSDILWNTYDKYNTGHSGCAQTGRMHGNFFPAGR